MFVCLILLLILLPSCLLACILSWYRFFLLWWLLLFINRFLHYMARCGCQAHVQFPVCLCFTATVHRSQGQTLNRVVFYLRGDDFMYGCLCVGLSRVRKSAIRILMTEDRICPYTLCAKAVNVLHSSFIPESLY